jgi:hypothetical protein
VRDLRTLSGPWKGFFVQRKRRGMMRCHLSFAGNQLAGTGDDADGIFQFEGEYFAEHHRVFLDKRYPDLTVHYDGRWDGLIIAGTWSFMMMSVTEEGTELHTAHGVFELWPEEHELSVAFDAQQDEALP